MNIIDHPHDLPVLSTHGDLLCTDGDLLCTDEENNGHVKENLQVLI